MVKRIAAFSFLCMLMVWGARPASAQISQIAGRVIGEDGQPLANALVSIDREDMKGHYEVKTGKDGNYRHAGVPLGVYSVSLMNGTTKVFSQNHVRTSSTDVTYVNINLQEERARTDAKAAGVNVGSGQKLTDEQMKAIEAQKSAKDDQIKKRQDLMVKYKAGMDALTAKDYDTAISDFQAAADMDATQTVLFAELGEAYGGKAQQSKDPAEKKDLLAKSADSYQKAITLKPDDATYHNNYALALANTGQVSDAQQELTKAAQLDPTNAGQYYFNLGAVLVNTGHMQEAADAFKKSTEATPPYTEGYYQLGVTLIGMATVDPKTGAMVPPPGTQEALNKYVQLAPTGPNVAAAKSLVDTLNATVTTDVKTGAGKPAKK